MDSRWRSVLQSSKLGGKGRETVQPKVGGTRVNMSGIEPWDRGKEGMRVILKANPGGSWAWRVAACSSRFCTELPSENASLRSAGSRTWGELCGKDIAILTKESSSKSAIPKGSWCSFRQGQQVFRTIGRAFVWKCSLGS